MTDYPSWVDSVVKWGDVDPADYISACNYLSIKLGAATARELIASLQGTPLVTRRSNDILRAIGRPPLPMSDIGVANELRTVLSGGRLSPVLIAQDDIADGYHRVSLVFNLDPFASVPIQIAQS